MVTWTFDFVALLIGVMFGIVIGAGIALYVMIRDDGLWKIGFMDGAQFKWYCEPVKTNDEEEIAE